MPPREPVGRFLVLTTSVAALAGGASCGPDDDPITLAAGTAFSTAPDPVQPMQAGLHYIRLPVRNDIIRARLESADGDLIGENGASFDFVELRD